MRLVVVVVAVAAAAVVVMLLHIGFLLFAIQLVVVGDFVEIVQAIGYRVSDVRRIL